MKQICLLVVIAMLHPFAKAQSLRSSHSFADSTPIFQIQKEPRFTLSIHGGYSLALGSTFRFYPDDITNITMLVQDNVVQAKNMSYRSPTKGLGDGFRFGAGLSYIINDFINVGLDIDYLKSSISKVKDSSYRELNSADVTDYSFRERYIITYDASLLSLTPNITFKAISRPRFFIYNKIGAVLTIRPNSIQREEQISLTTNNIQGAATESTSTVQKRYDWGIRNPAFGFMGAIGMQVKISERVRSFAELRFSHILFKVKSRSLKELIVNGEETVSTLPLSDREIEFENNLEASEWNKDPELPSKAIVQRFPVTFVGVQAGLAFRF